MKPARRAPARNSAPAPPDVASGAPSGRDDRQFLRAALVIFAVALAIRLVHVWQISRSPFYDLLLGDAQAYDAWAQRIAAGDWIGTEVFYQAPLYPYFLAVIYKVLGHGVLAPRIAQAILGAASCALLGLAGHRFFSKGAGIAAGIGLAIYAPAIFFDGLLQKSSLDLFFLSLALWVVSRLIERAGSPGEWLGLGLAMGGLSLTRENGLVFIAVLGAWILTRARASRGGFALVRPLVMFAAGLAVVLVPVAARNAAVGGGFYLTTSQFGPNFYIGNNPKSDGTYMSLRFGRGAPEYERQDATELAEYAVGRRLTPAEVSGFWTDRAMAFITGSPGAWAKLMARKFLLLWNATEMLDTESQESYAEYSLPLRALGWFGHFGVLVPLAVIGAFVAWPVRRRAGILFAMTGIYAASVLIFYVFARYRLPLVPLLMLFAGLPVSYVVSGLSQTGANVRSGFGQTGGVFTFTTLRIHPLATVVVVAVVVFANWPTLTPQLMMAVTENNLGNALQAQKRYAEAVAHYRRASELQPSYAPAYNNLGVAQRASGRLDEAIASYRRALSVEGTYPDAHYNLANALLEKNLPKEAAAHFEIALKSIPDSAGIRNNLGVALAAQGRPGDAIAAFRAAVAAEPNSSRAHRNLGSALADVGRIDEALAALTTATQVDPNDAEAHYNLGVVLLQAGQHERAERELRATLRLTPQAPEAHNNLGIALASTGRMREAAAEFERALTIAPGFTDAQRNLAMARQALEER
jgi:tetratricopeptide (TPR) repeat protein